MRDIKMTTVIDRSLIRTSNILFDHFSLKTWLKLAFIACFAGALFSFGSNFQGIGKNQHPATEPKSVTSAQKAGTADANAGAAASSATQTAPAQKSFKEQLASVPKAVWAIAPAILIFTVIFIVLFAWISSRFKFIWFHAIATRDVTIVEPFHRHKSQANSFFKISLVLFLVGLVLSLVLLAGLIYFVYQAGVVKPGFADPGASIVKLVVAALVFFLILLVFSIFVYVLIDHFVVTVMALDKISFVPAFKKMWRIFRANKKDIFLFYVVMFLLSIASSVIGLVLAILCLIVLVLAGVLIFGLGYLLLVAAIKAMPLFIGYCLILGIPFIGGTVLLFILISVPFAVFFRSYSIEYLCALNCGYSYESLESYDREKSAERSKTFIWAPISFVLLFVCLFFAGIAAAIAVPNFIKARDAAKARITANAQNTPVNSTASHQ